MVWAKGDRPISLGVKGGSLLWGETTFPPFFVGCFKMGNFLSGAGGVLGKPLLKTNPHFKI